MFRLTLDEWETMRHKLQPHQEMIKYAVTKCDRITKRECISHSLCFYWTRTAMLSGILTQIKNKCKYRYMRAFVMVRQYALTYKELTAKLKEIESKFTDVYEAIITCWIRISWKLNKNKESVLLIEILWKIPWLFVIDRKTDNYSCLTTRTDMSTAESSQKANLNGQQWTVNSE